ncbi:Origin recognition complex subunit 3 [Candidozyma auris]|uniref:Origin recognition complex subunit 3 n=2 Tax=Candidozyma auris TaxID=498019 RepID=A0AB36W2I0_CANAR|nr:hypothetical protein CJI97_002343 [[Candida] auris]PIS55577.1 hypothetical protein B9J08_001681 [[Candida] auris]QWW22773.1 hypothetical protein CA7LBN_001520 [[Candida] auris]
MPVRGALDHSSQKTHYTIDTSERKRIKKEEISACPFISHEGESASLTKHRYNLYEKVWNHQLGAIQRILNSANDQFFANLVQFVDNPFPSKLATAFLGLSSNTANNLRTLDEFAGHLYQSGRNQHVRLVMLDSKECIHIKAAMREFIKQVLEPKSRLQDDPIASFDEEQEQDQKTQVEEDEDLDAVDGDAGDGGRISYDFEIVEEWVDAYINRTNSKEHFRIVVVLQDSDAFSNEILNQLVHLLSVYCKTIPIKLIMALSSKGISDWISRNITSRSRTLINATKLEARNNKDICFQVIDNILLRNEITSENPLLLDAQLSSIVLNRFENSNNSIDSLVTEFKLTYMIHFYQSPLSIMVDPDFAPQSFHFDALRKLPSFKTHIEFLLHSFQNLRNEKNDEDAQAMSEKINELLTSDQAIYDLFRSARSQLQKYQNAVMNAIHIIHFLSSGEKQVFQLYKLVTNNQLINSSYLSDVLKTIRSFDDARIKRFSQFIQSETIKITIDDVTDEDTLGLKRALSRPGITSEQLLRLITDYLHENPALNMKISDNLFNEVLTITGGISEMDKLLPKVTIEESYENLMIKLIRPRSKEALESALDQPQQFLKNNLVLSITEKKHNSSKVIGPLLPKLYHIYKDAPVNINIWDFFVAFKSSIPKKEILDELKKQIRDYVGEFKDQMTNMLNDAAKDDTKWERLVYAWFIQSSAELTTMGFLREKTKGDYVEKLIWKNL